MIPHIKIEKPAKGTLFLVALASFLAIVGLIFHAGIGQALNIYEKTIFAFLAISLFYFIINSKPLYIHRSSILLVLLLIIHNLFCYWQSGATYIDYLRIFIIFIPFAFFPIHEKLLKYISLIYGAFGILVLLSANLTSLFDGWDGNSISLNAFFAYVVFIISFCDTKKPKILIFLTLYSITYYLLLIKFNSRSTILFSIFIFLCILSIIPIRKFLNTTWLIIILLVPLIVAIIIVSIRDTELATKLNIWSLTNTNKPIFNGRDVLWKDGFEIWLTHPLFGLGNTNYTAHNSAVSILVGGGITGYLLLFIFLFSLLKKGLRWISDNTVFGLVIAFLTVWLQQSVELGLIGSKVNPIPYLILALLYSRMKTLENMYEQENGFTEHSNSHL